MKIVSNTSFGVPAGANSPCHAIVPTPGYPISCIVGTSGNSGRRWWFTSASGRSLPALTWAAVDATLRNEAWVSPVIMSLITPDAPFLL